MGLVVVDGEEVILVVDASHVDISRLLTQRVQPGEPYLHDQVVLDSSKARVVLLLHQERDVLAREIPAFMTDIGDDDLCPGARPGECGCQPALAVEKLFERHTQDVNPSFRRIASGAREDGTAGTERLYHAVCAVGVSRDGMTKGR